MASGGSKREGSSGLSQQIARLSRDFLQRDPEALDSAIEEGLEAIGLASGADRISLRYVESEDAEFATQRAWVAEGVPHRSLSAEVTKDEKFALLRRAMLTGDLVQVAFDAEPRSPIAAELAAIPGLDAKSLLALPIRVGASLRGALWLECVRNEIVYDADEISWLGIGAEILAGAIMRRNSALAMRESESRFRALTDHVTELIAEIAADGTLEYVSPSYKELLGYEPQALLGTPSQNLLHPDDSGDSIRSFSAAVSDGGISHSVHRLLHADGSWRWFDNTGRPYRNATGEVRFVSVGRDITERRQMEEALQESQAQLMQAQKMEALGRLAGGIAHDFNNLLMIILGNAEALRARLERAALPRRETDEILQAVERAADLTRQLLAFGRPGPRDVQRTDVRSLISYLGPMLERLLGGDVELELELTEELCTVEAPMSQLEQVLINLVVNGRDAMPEGGGMIVTAGREHMDAEHAARLGLGTSGEYVRISVTDEGVGIDPEIREHVFEPFFTTKRPGKGTGLGLSVVYGVVRGLGGVVEIESASERATTFAVYLPRVDAEADTLEPIEADGEVSGSGTVLAVEDEPMSRRLVRGMLERCGYSVLEAADGTEAIQIADAYAGEIDLVVTDMMMPKMRGPELVQHLRAKRPEIRVLFVSGYADSTEVGGEGTGFLAKPFSHAQLRDKARSLLAKEA